MLTNGTQIIAKVLEVNEIQVKYQRFDNPEGPLYLINIQEILRIVYNNGVIDTFITGEENSNNSNPSSEEIFKILTQKGNKVFIDSHDKSAIIHASNTMKEWGYWVLVDEEKDADFILRINFKRIAPGTYHGFAQFVEPEGNVVLKSTREVNGVANVDLNGKRVFIKKLINYEIRSFI